jgi:hypothetical protein
MTVRQGKWLTWIIAALAVVTIVLDVVSYYLRPDRFRLSDAMMPLFLLVSFLTLRQSYRRIEAANGPDYEMSIKGGRLWLVLLVGLLAILGGALVYLIVNQR